MNDDAAAIAAIRSVAGRQHEWPEAARELAYQLWAFVCGRDAKAVAARMADMDDGYDVPERTVRRWVNDANWPDRAAHDLAAIAPDIRRQAVTELIAGSLEAARYLRTVARGDHVLPDKVRVQAATVILDRVGLGPRQDQGTDLISHSPPTITHRNLRSLSDEELLALEEGE